MRQTISPFAWRILELATEDYTGLWEILALARGHFRDTPSETLQRLSKESVIWLAEAGWVEFYVGSRFDGEQRLISLEDVDLGSIDNWRGDLPSSQEHVRLKATPKGRTEQDTAGRSR